MFNKVLIANRGEIACRIMRSCKKLSVKTVAIYSDVDHQAQHVKLADESYRVGESESSESYLNIHKIIEIAKKSKCDALHPGYGFLSENGQFARQLKKSKIELIGPPAETIELMGDKLRAKELAQTVNAPILPGIEISNDKSGKKALANFINKYGFPLLIKAAAGGGGRGMRKVYKLSELDDLLTAAAREAKAFFNDQRVFVERLIENGRHIEVQVIGDKFGSVVHLFCRDCTVQRKHQKVIEEAPAPNIDPKLRDNLYSTAVAICRAAKYQNAGTVEFLLDVDSGEFFFLEVNSRLQVEHPITEEIAGLDLVELQLRVASGERLSKIPLPAAPQGCSIECRICSEVPELDFVAATGRIEQFSVPNQSSLSATVRFDTGYRSGDLISHYYDSLLGKLIVHAANRELAIAALTQALCESRFLGVKTNVGFILSLLRSPEFNSARHTTNLSAQILSDDHYGIVARFLSGTACLFRLSSFATHPAIPWHSNMGFRIAGRAKFSAHLIINGKQTKLELVNSGLDTYEFAGDFPGDYDPKLEIVSRSNHLVTIVYRGSEIPFYIYDGQNSNWVSSTFGTYEVQADRPTLKQSLAGKTEVSGDVCSPFPGKVIEIKTEAGASVDAGDVLLILESMKMEHPLKAPISAKVQELFVSNGEIVEANKLLARLGDL